MINLIVEEHIKRDLIIYLVFAEINITCIINHAYYILHAICNFEDPIGTCCSICRLVKSYIVVYLMPPLIYISDKFIRQQV